MWKILKFLFTIACAGMILYGLFNLSAIKVSEADTQNKIDEIKKLAMVSINVEEEEVPESEFRERDPFSTDIGEEYYWGFDEDVPIDLIQREPTTLNSKSTGNYYMEIDFDVLKEEYPNMIAYMKVNGTGIEYPIVQGENNSFYLKHSIDNSYSQLGWPFMDYRSNPDSMIGNTVIYGHNIRNKGVFGELVQLLDSKDWFNTQSNKEIYFITRQKTYVYKIFSVYNSVPTFNYFKTSFANSKEFDDFFSVISGKNKVSSLDEGIQALQMLTLSTCYNSGKQRLVVHAYLERVKDRA